VQHGKIGKQIVAVTELAAIPGGGIAELLSGVRKRADQQKRGDLPPARGPAEDESREEPRYRGALLLYLHGPRAGVQWIYRPGLRSVIIFHGQRATFDELADDFPADHAYWKERGWLDPSVRYYTSAPINPLYDAVGRIVEWAVRRRLRQDIAAMR